MRISRLVSVSLFFAPIVPLWLARYSHHFHSIYYYVQICSWPGHCSSDKRNFWAWFRVNVFTRLMRSIFTFSRIITMQTCLDISCGFHSSYVVRSVWLQFGLGNCVHQAEDCLLASSWNRGRLLENFQGLELFHFIFCLEVLYILILHLLSNIHSI